MNKKFLLDFSWIAFFILFFIFLKLCVIGLYLVPSPSMLPCLIPGDRIIANKLAYNLRVPFLQSILFQWSTPKRGDVVLFSFSGEDEIYVKRVIGLSGDLISFKEGKILINGEQLNLQNASQVKSNSQDFNLYKEENTNLFQDSHQIYLSKEPARTFFEARRFLVPPGKIFVLGDNRDNSADSRIYGYVDMNRVYGRASYILFSTTGESLRPQFRKERWMKKVW